MQFSLAALVLLSMSVVQAKLDLSQGIRILCFGDSLTEGWIAPGYPIHPYAISLNSELQKAFPNTTISISNEGLGGDQVHSPPGQFLPRINTIYGDSDERYDFAIVLGGTNDFFNGGQSGIIYSSLKKVWNVALKHDTKVLAMTVIDCVMTPEVVNVDRATLNGKIMAHDQKGVYELDLAKAVPYFAMPDEQRKDIWFDGVHFTEEGYDLVGRTIATRLIEVITAEVNSPVSKYEQIEL